MSRALLSLSAGLLIFLGSAAQAQAPLDEARGAFERGRVAYEEGRFEASLTAFRRAYALTSSADILYNIGTVADRLRRDRLALESYRGYLEARPDSEDRAQVEARIAVLQAQVEADDEAARAADERSAREARLREELERRGAPLPAPTPGEPARAAERSPVPWVVVGVGAAALATGIALVVAAAVDAACVSEPSGCVAEGRAPRWEEVAGAYDRVPVFNGVGGALVGVGAAAVAIGLAWGIGQGADEAPVAVRLGPGAVAVAGSFP